MPLVGGGPQAQCLVAALVIHVSCLKYTSERDLSHRFAYLLAAASHALARGLVRVVTALGYIAGIARRGSSSSILGCN